MAYKFEDFDYVEVSVRLRVIFIRIDVIIFNIIIFSVESSKIFFVIWSDKTDNSYSNKSKCSYFKFYIIKMSLDCFCVFLSCDIKIKSTTNIHYYRK